MTKFHEDRAKTVDFLLLVNFWPSPVFLPQSLDKDATQLSGRPDRIDELSKVYGWVPGQIYPKPNKNSLKTKSLVYGLFRKFNFKIEIKSKLIFTQDRI